MRARTRLGATEAGGPARIGGPNARPRVAFIGVDPDARGGIAQFGANLVRSVEDSADTLIVSYRRLYPRFTRPGRQGPDPTPQSSGLDGMPILIPWERSTWMRAAETLERFGPDLVVLQWWSPLFAPCVRYLARRMKRAGARVAIVCHNDRAHEGFPFGHSLTRAALGEADILLTLSSAVTARVEQLVPNAAVLTLQHPPNMPAAETGQAGGALRRRLGQVDGPLVLFFGNVRKYKGLGDLIAAMPLVRREVNASLVAAGTFFEPIDRFRAQAKRLGLRLDNEVILLPGYVPRDQAPALFARADVVVLPYRSASQSGVIAQAALAGKPVVVTAVGGLPEAIGGRGVVVPPADPAALAAGIVSALQEPPPPPPLARGGWNTWRDVLLAEVPQRAAAAPAPAPPAPTPPAPAPADGGSVRTNGHSGNGEGTSAAVAAAPAPVVSPTALSDAMRADNPQRELTAALGQAVWEVVRLRIVEPQEAPALEPEGTSITEPLEAPVAKATDVQVPREAPPAESPQAPPLPAYEPESPAEPEILGSPRWPLAIFVTALMASIAAGIWTHATERVGLFGDAASHLLHGRRVFDSITPGFGQLGNYWPPLQHFLELPFVWIDPLYQSMWAGSLPAMAFYVIGVMGAYRLGLELTSDRRAGALAALAFGANPSLLYLQATPMLESAIAMSLVWSAASLIRFRRTGRFRDVVIAGLWSSVAVWSTWGAIILPFYGAIVVAAACRRRGFGWRQTETYALAYALAAGYALLLWMSWNFYIQHDPLYMFHYHQPVSQLVTNENFVSGERGDPSFAFLNYGAAVVDLLGPVVTTLMLIVLAGAIVRRRVLHPGGVALIGGGLVIAYLIFKGTAIGSPLWADLRDLSGGEARNLNIRYALWLMPFVPVAVAVLAGRSRLRQSAVLVAVLAGMVWFLPSVHGVSTIDPAAQSSQRVAFESDLGDVLGRALRPNDDRLLMSSINGGDRLIWRSKIDTARFLTEANGDRFSQALDAPPRYAGWALLAPGSSIAARYTLAELVAMGYAPVWSNDGRAGPDSTYVLLRRGPA